MRNFKEIPQMCCGFFKHVLTYGMIKFPRIIDITGQSRKKSVFLFGPRQTGKTFLMREVFPDCPYYNLILSDVFMRLSQRPQLLREELKSYQAAGECPVIIDEIQKLPLLLDEIHNLIEERDLHFILTGSSARKLKRGGANLLGGRAWTLHLFPLVSQEITDFSLVKALNFGTLPSVYLSDTPEEDLLAYCGTYLKEEIQAESLVRRIDNFSRFLQSAGIMNAELLNFEAVASDCAVPSRTVREYFGLLEDTLVGSILRPYQKTQKRKPISTGKFYFFDVGVANTLAGRRNIRPKTELFGKALEHFIHTELRAYMSYTRDRRELTFWRSRTGDFEVDFLLGDDTAIEVKSTEMVTERCLKSLRALAEDLSLRHKIVVSLDPVPRELDSVKIFPVGDFLRLLWQGSFSFKP